MPCQTRLVESIWGNAITPHQKPSSSAFPARRQVWQLHCYQGAWQQAMEEGAFGHFRGSMRLRKRNATRSADANQAFKGMRSLQGNGDKAKRLNYASASQAVGAHDGSLHQSQKQVVQRLRRSRNYCLRPMGERGGRSFRLRMLSTGHGRLSGGANARAQGLHQGLFSRKLHLGFADCAGPQSPFCPDVGISGQNTARVSLGAGNGDSIFHAYAPTWPWVVGRTCINGGYLASLRRPNETA